MRAEPRQDLGQAMQRWPDEVFAPLGGAVFHVVKDKLTVPATFCFALCGATGFAPGVTFEAQTDEPICLRCQGQLTRSEARQGVATPKDSGVGDES